MRHDKIIKRKGLVQKKSYPTLLVFTTSQGPKNGQLSIIDDFIKLKGME